MEKTYTYTAHNIPSQKCHMNMGMILNSDRDTSIWNVAWVSRFGHAHSEASAPVALQLAKSAIRLCSHMLLHYWTVNMAFTFPNEKYVHIHFVYWFCNGNMIVAVEEYKWWFP